jgi:hypothetical protein
MVTINRGVKPLVFGKSKYAKLLINDCGVRKCFEQRNERMEHSLRIWLAVKTLQVLSLDSFHSSTLLLLNV